MTLQSSPPISAGDINVELGRSRSAAFHINGTEERWLAGKPSGPISFSDFLGKSATRLVSSYSDDATKDPTYTFTGCDFGAAFTGRVIVVVAHIHSTVDAILNQTAVSIGGLSATGDDTGESLSSLTGSAGVGIWAAKPSGTNGTVSVTYSNGGFPTHPALGCSITILSLSGISSTTPTATVKASGNGSGLSSYSSSINIPSGGVLVLGVTRESTSALTFTGASEVADATFDTSARRGVALTSGLSSQTGRSIGFSSSGMAASGFMAAAFS